jgi:replicative DNA helicase
MSYKYYNELKQKQESWSESHPNCIPFTNFPRFSKHITLNRGQYTLLTANSGVGKSRFLKDLYIHNAIDFTANKDIDLDITYFSLEEGVDRFYKLELCRQLYKQHGILMTLAELESKGLKRLSRKHLEYVKNIENKFFPQLERSLKVVDERDSEKIYKYILDQAEKKGKIHYKDMNGQKVFSHYETNPNSYNIFIIDHLKLLSGRGRTKDIMDRFSSEYIVKTRNRFNFSFVVVQQQAAASEKQNYTNRGSLIPSMEPSLDGLGEHKLTQQDADIVLGLYNPHRYNQDEHNGYNIRKLKNKYRAIKILKNRDGMDTYSVGMHFEGAPGIFSELPSSNDPLIQNYYE